MEVSMQIKCPSCGSGDLTTTDNTQKAKETVWEEGEELTRKIVSYCSFCETEFETVVIHHAVRHHAGDWS